MIRRCIHLDDIPTRIKAGIVLESKHYCEDLRWDLSPEEVKKRCKQGACFGYRPTPEGYVKPQKRAVGGEEDAD